MNPGRLRWTAQTDPGRYRRHNEDAFLALTFDRREARYLGKTGQGRLSDGDYMFAVSDGIGGAVAGEFVSQLAVKTVMALVSKAFHQTARSVPAQAVDLLPEFCRDIHRRAIQVSEPYPECRNMGATFSLAWFQKDALAIAHVGDSRVYRLPPSGGIEQITIDHTLPGRLKREGKITEREARDHPQRNKLEMAIGGGLADITPQIEQFALEPGARFALCTDGVTDGLWDHAVEKLIRTPPPYLEGVSAADRLIREARDASGRDNLTAIVVDFEP